MAKAAGEDKMITVRCDGSVVRGRVALTLARPAASVLVRQALAWVATQSGATTLASSISGLADASAFASDEFVEVNLRQGQNGTIICQIKRMDSGGLEVTPTLETDLSATGLKDALAAVAASWGFSALSSAIAAI